MAEDTKKSTSAPAKSLLEAFCVSATIHKTLAKCLPEALNVLANARLCDSDAKQEALSMQLHIGLDGRAHTVPLKHGAGMVGLRKTVLRMTGIPVDEQKYIFVDDARMVDNDCPVPTEQALRCVWTTNSSDDSSEGDEQTADVSEDASDKGSLESEERSLASEEQESSKYQYEWSEFVAPGESWADASEDLIDAHGLHRSSIAYGTASLAQRFTSKWRQRNERMRQHRFYIAIPEQHRERFQVTKRIRRACSSFYKKDQIMVRLRGRGSGYLEGKSKKESTDPLMICLSGREPYETDDYWDSFHKILVFLEEVLYAQYNRVVAQGRGLAQELHIDEHSVRGGANHEFLHRAAQPASIQDALRDEADAGLLWAWEFTEAWRRWNEREHQHQFFIAIPEHRFDDFKITPRLKRACKSIYTHNVMIRLRGKGSGFLEGKRKKESPDPLMICLSGRDPYLLSDYWTSFYKISALLEADIYADYNRSLGNRSKRGAQAHLQYEFVNGGARKGGRK
mmetsp:Transcript_119927/g.208254  ORF Transcript_119927/g.208254 Transcript_119927/m.208254 type:complete len:510 (+) Transcript_119927:85-1614(+)